MQRYKVPRSFLPGSKKAAAFAAAAYKINYL